MSIYHMINVFFLFSFMGYVLECIVLTIQYKKLVINRGFGHGPFCIIYGFGALGAYLVLSPFEGHFVQLYFASMLMAIDGVGHCSGDDSTIWFTLVGL